jgi:CRISPR-associated endonuclease Cas1
MKATKTVAQPARVCKLPQKPNPRPPAIIHFRRLFSRDHGVVVLVGYGIKVCVDRGHLMLEDGIGNDRRAGRFPRVHHGLRRVVVIGADGMVSLAALRWLADQNIAFVMLDRDGSVLLSTGPVAASDTRLRRAQACAAHSEAAVDIVRELIRLKLTGQEELVRQKLGNSTAADLIARYSTQLKAADSIDTVRMLEGHAAGIYWTAWQSVPVQFPKNDLPRLPDHWRTFGTRRSAISGTSRRPPNPVNAILNYLYTLLESETRLAITALGLDPGFGLLHVDHATRDSLVYDLMEPVRPKIDAYVLDWITRTPLKRSWFFEERDGCCRLMSDFTVQISNTIETWSREVAPIVEWFAHTLSSYASENGRVRSPGTRLTQRRRYEGQGASVPTQDEAPKQHSVCTLCGVAVTPGNRFCHCCGLNECGKRLSAVQHLGKDAARTPEALDKKSKKMNAHRDAIRNWQPSDIPDWLTDDLFMTRLYPAIDQLSKGEIASALGVSKDYAYQIANGNKVPHRRHWLKLAELVGIAATPGT